MLSSFRPRLLQTLSGYTRADFLADAIAGVHTQPFMALSRGGFVERLGQENFCANMDASLARAAQLAK